MEILIGAAVLLVLLFCLTGDWGVILITLAGLAALSMLVFLGFFIYFLVCLLSAEKKTARFVRFEKSEKRRFESAVYEIDGGQYPDVFPAEPIFRERIYREGVPVKLRFSEKRGAVYDKSTRVTIIAGTAAFALSSAAIIFILLNLI